MKQKLLRLVALMLILAVMLSGCSLADIGQALDRLYTMVQIGMTVKFEDMEYVRPDMTGFQECLDQTMEQVKTQKDVDLLMESVYLLYEYFYDFSTNHALANIHYSRDMTDIYWQKEYAWCMENSARISAGMDRVLYALADCPLREELENDDFFGEGFFDAYDGESLWDETFTALMEQEAQLLNRYYDLNAQSAEIEPYSEAYFAGCGYEIEKVFLELIAVRQQIAEYAGYESYPDFAYAYYFYRDYTPDQAWEYMQQVRQELVPLYTQLDDAVWAPMYEQCTPQQTLEYVENCADAMGGVAADALLLMKTAQLYDITYSEKKYDASFEIYLMSYYVPYVFMNPQGNQRDQLTFAHEFGHFCNDYAAGGSVVGVDVAEVFSQSMEYLSLCYCEDTQALTRMEMADSLCTFVEQSAYACFEQQVYGFTQEQLTVENVRELYRQINEDFGMGSLGRDYRDYTLVPHFFISPMYVVSYVVSNDGAMQIYQAEQEESGKGLKLWEEGLFTTQMGYLAFTQEAGLRSPFEEGAVARLRETFEKN